MSDLQYPRPRDNWCRIHQRTYYGFRCPQCIQDEKNKQFEKVIEPIRKAEQKKEAQEELSRILADLEKATLIEETPDYKRLTCPYCGKDSLVYYKPSKEYECLNRECGLNSTIRLRTEQSNWKNSVWLC